MAEKENLLSLLPIEVLISHVQIELNIECHLPCIVFRLLDYPAVSISYFDSWQIEEFHTLKKIHPKISWRQLLSDQFYELRSANGHFNFKRGKSCLFKTYFQTFYRHLLNVPLFLLLIDQINDQNANTSHFIGSCNVKLNELIEILNQSILKNGYDIPLVEQQTFHCTLFNLMGTKIGTCDVAVRFCHYGTTILTHLPMLNEGPMIKMDEKASTTTKEQVNEPAKQSIDAIVKHIHFVNEKKDIGLQISRSDLPSTTSNLSKSAQTRWTSTKNRTSNYHQSKGRYLRVMEDPSLDDSTIAFYRPPALYFNSDSDFLQMMTPATTKFVEEATENRLSYLASIPIASFDSESDAPSIIDNDHNEKKEKPKPKRKISSNVHVDVSSTSTVISQPKTMFKQPLLTKDFLQNFPLLRALVEEALALQQHQFDRPRSISQTMFAERPQSAIQQRQKIPKQGFIRPKSVIVPRNVNHTRRLYPTPAKTNQMIVTKNEVRNLVDRLSKPKPNKQLETTRTSARQSTKSVSTLSTSRSSKPALTYGTTRAHRLMVEFSRTRRAGLEPPVASSPRPLQSPKKESPSNNQLSPPSLQLPKAKAISPSPLLSKVDVDTTTIEKNISQRPSLNVIPEHLGTITKSESTTSRDVTLKLNQTLTKTTSSTSTFILSTQKDQKNEDLNFSITDVTDYFTDGGESSTRPPTRQST